MEAPTIFHTWIAERDAPRYVEWDVEHLDDF
jgi:hypothetical protein